VCFAKHTLSKHNLGRLGLKPKPDPLLFSFWAGSSPAICERFTHACNSNQLIILARKEGNLPRRAATRGKVEGDWAKKKGLKGAAASIGFAAPFFLCFSH
jgi:hypothetical protein